MEFEFWKALLRIIITLPFVLLLAFLFIKYVVVRKKSSFGQGYLQVIEQIGVGNRANLIIVRIGEEYYLFGVTEQRIELLLKLDDYSPKTDLSPGTEKFSYILTKLTNKQGVNEHEK